jgi:hypothetical protein
MFFHSLEDTRESGWIACFRGPTNTWAYLILVVNPGARSHALQVELNM